MPKSRISSLARGGRYLRVGCRAGAGRGRTPPWVPGFATGNLCDGCRFVGAPPGALAGTGLAVWLAVSSASGACGDPGMVCHRARSGREGQKKSIRTPPMGSGLSVLGAVFVLFCPERIQISVFPVPEFILFDSGNCNSPHGLRYENHEAFCAVAIGERQAGRAAAARRYCVAAPANSAPDHCARRLGGAHPCFLRGAHCTS